MHKIWVLWLILSYRNPFWKNIFWKCIKGALPTSVELFKVTKHAFTYNSPFEEMIVHVKFLLSYAPPEISEFKNRRTTINKTNLSIFLNKDSLSSREIEKQTKKEEKHFYQPSGYFYRGSFFFLMRGFRESRAFWSLITLR